MPCRPKYNHERIDECGYPGGMRPRPIASLPPLPRQALDHLYRTTNAPRLRTWAQLGLRSGEPGLKGPQRAAIVRESEAMVLRGLKRDVAEGIAGLQAAPRPGRPSEVTAADRAALLAAVRRRPRSGGLPFSRWPLPRLVDDLAEQTRIRLSAETVRRALKHAGIGLRRPPPQISRPDSEEAGKKDDGRDP
jgi:transposase